MVVPELPEVEIARRNLERWLSGRKVVKAHAPPSRIFRGADRAAFAALRGRLLFADRKGKYLLLAFESGGAVAHLGMTGKWVRRPPKVEEPYSRASLTLDDRQVLHFKDPRMFGRIEPAPVDRLWEAEAVRKLGLDPLKEGLTAATLKKAIGKTRLPMKVALMDQARLAGLGNIHAAEACFRAGIHPGRAPETLTENEWKRLANAIRQAIAFALRQQQDEEIAYVEEPGSDNPFHVYGRAGERCRKCKAAVIKSIPQGGRTTFFCPKCQPKGTRR